MTRNLLALTLTAALCSAATAKADPGFQVMQVDLRCGDAHACKSYNKWIRTRITWFGGGGETLYTENTLSWIDHGNMGSLTLYLDGNGNPADFVKYYEDPVTNILNTPGLAIQVEADKQNAGKYEFVMKQAFRPYPWALWALHSGDSAGFRAELVALKDAVANLKPDMLKCPDNQYLKAMGGTWTCAVVEAQVAKVPRDTALFLSNHPSCGGTNSVTTAATCTYDPGAGMGVTPACEEGCTFAQTAVVPMCAKTCANCDGFGCTWSCCPGMKVDGHYGTCQCNNKSIGFTIP